MEAEKDKRNKTTEKKKGSFVKKVFKVLLYIVLCFFALNGILYGLLSIPFIQNKLVDFASKELSSMLKTEVRINEARFNLFSRVSLKGLYVEDQTTDTLAYAGHLGAKFKTLDFILHGRLQINKVELEDFKVNITAPSDTSDYNFQFIVDRFASTDTTKVDTTTSTLDLVIDDIHLTNGQLSYRIKDKPETPYLFNAADIEISDFNADVNVYSIDMAKLDVRVNVLTAKDKSGLEIKQLQGKVLSEGSRLRIEDLLFELPNSHLKSSVLFYDMDSQEFEVATEDTEIWPQDLIAFLPNLKYLEHKLSLKTSIKGKLPLVDAEKIFVSYGSDAVLDGNAFISNYEDLEKADIEVNVTELSATPKGIGTLAKLGDETFVVPDILNTLGRVSLNAQLNGKLGSFKLTSKASAKTGALNLSANGAIDTTFTNFDMKANLNTKGFDLAPFVGEERGVGKLAMHIDLEAKQNGVGNLEAKLKGAVDSLKVMRGAITHLPFAGYYNKEKMGFGADAKLRIGRVMAGFEMTRADKPDIKLALNLSDFDVAHFYKNKLWDKPMLDFKIRGEIRKFDIDNLNADISIKDLQFADKDFDYQPGPIVFKAWQDTAEVKHITLSSSIMSASIDGDYKFSTLSDEFSDLMHHYLSNVFPEHEHNAANANDFNFKVEVNNSEELGYIFDLPVNIIDPLTINGTVNTKRRKIDVVGVLPYAQATMFDIKNVKLNIANMDSAFSANLDADLYKDKARYDLTLDIKGADNAMRSVVTIDNDSANVKMKGRINALAQFTLGEDKELVSMLEVIPSNIQIGNFAINLLPARITNEKERTEIANFGIGVNNKKYLDVNGVISQNEGDSLHINFNKAQIADILQGLNINDIYAEVDGSILATKLLKAPELYTRDFNIKNIVLHKDTIGTVNVETSWNPEMSGIKLESSLTQRNKKVMSIGGLVDPSKEALDLHMDIDRFSIGWIKPFMKGLLTDISGDVSSHFTIKGKFDEPITEGFFGFNDAKIALEYTNVTYYISDTIDIRPDRIGFDNLVMRDSEGNRATANARLTHRNFKNMKYSLDMRIQNLMVLNTQSRTDSLFYGKLFASGTVNINGSDEGIDLNMQLANGKRSNLNITLPQVAEATDYKSVVYINVPEEKLLKEEEQKRPAAKADIPIRIKMKLDVTPDIALGVVIDPNTGDRMNVKGSGTINFNYDMESELMTVYGDYKVTDGSVKINLQRISHLDFKIKEGSKLNFVGDPLNTKFDITAYRRVKADLRTLDASFDQDSSSPRVQVDCLLGISGDINKMNMTYNLELYDASEDQVRKFNSIVSTNEARVRQFAYLVAFGTFYSGVGSSGANFAEGVWTGLASSALSAGLNSVFGSMLGDNWQLGAEISDEDRSVNATTSLLNDKLVLHANVGYRADNSTNVDNSFIGDFDIEYLLNSIWTLKAYSHTNDKFYKQAPTTQGVGIVFTRDAATLKQLFRSFRPRRGQWNRQPNDSLRIRRDSMTVDSGRVRRNYVERPVIAPDSLEQAVPQSTNDAKRMEKQPARKEE